MIWSWLIIAHHCEESEFAIIHVALMIDLCSPAPAGLEILSPASAIENVSMRILVFSVNTFRSFMMLYELDNNSDIPNRALMG